MSILFATEYVQLAINEAKGCKLIPDPLYHLLEQGKLKSDWD
jgi:hypothetical protein